MYDDEPEIPDPILVQRALAGSSAAFTCLFHRYYERVRGFAYRIVLDHSSADDVAQDTFIRAAEKLGTLRDCQSFPSWIFRMASNAAKDHLRSRSSHQRKLEALSVLTEPSTSSEHECEPDLDRVHQAMQALPHRQREAVALVWFENCSHAEAAARAGCAESTISWRMALAKRTLRKKLSQ